MNTDSVPIIILLLTETAEELYKVNILTGLRLGT